ncbi:hypothetical protein CIHG_05853 [Coccidioides immitis H538.4]|uniref:Uncharacterized protein n=2 Tax=Coccidioides immitis TaxID=5501 RepID=A0A0J8RS79_COCIT|nr:hypothetical protein CIRG_01918 [Coccidioides immitis RMSCC 2394]KMU88085.1 hypothetical protein CIHG_05853 [Coccidioides immitis H538.4]
MDRVLRLGIAFISLAGSCTLKRRHHFLARGSRKLSDLDRIETIVKVIVFFFCFNAPKTSVTEGQTPDETNTRVYPPASLGELNTTDPFPTSCLRVDLSLPSQPTLSVPRSPGSPPVASMQMVRQNGVKVGPRFWRCHNTSVHEVYGGLDQAVRGPAAHPMFDQHSEGILGLYNLNAMFWTIEVPLDYVKMPMLMFLDALMAMKCVNAIKTLSKS